MSDSHIDGPTAIVLIAHGSRTVSANKAHRQMAVDLEAMLAMPVWAAFLELADPLIPAAIHQATAAGAAKVLVLPYFLYPGRHLSLDIPELVATTAAMHPEVEIVTMPGFGEDPAVLGLLVAQVRRANARA
jgi:sirohydrochlorin ferrochelatase